MDFVGRGPAVQSQNAPSNSAEAVPHCPRPWGSVIGPRCFNKRDDGVFTPEQLSSDASVDSASVPEVLSLSWSSTAASSTVTDDEDLELSLSSSTRSFTRLHTSQKAVKESRSPNSTAISPRSSRNIFAAYWDSPSNQTTAPTLSHEDADELELFKLSPSKYPFKLPLVDPQGADESDQRRCPVVDQKPEYESDDGGESDKSDSRPPRRRLSIDDSDVPYTAPADATFRRRRRQILPKPPAYTAMSSSLTMPRHSVSEHQVYDSSAPKRNWNSTSALIKPKGCLRPSRYSSSSISSSAEDTKLLRRSASASIPVPLGNSRALRKSASVDCAGIVPTLSGRRRLNLSQRNSGCYNLSSTTTASCESKSQSPPEHSRQNASKNPELEKRHRSASCDLPRPRRQGITKSVSFYSQVDVYEFHLPTEQTSDEGWLKYFF